MKKFKLRDLLVIKNGCDHKRLKVGGFPVYGSGGIMRYVDSYLYNKPSILLPRKGTLSNIQYAEKPFWTVDTIYYTEINTHLVNSYYLYLYLKMLDLSNLDSGTGVPSMTFDSYYNLVIELPEKEIQDKIAKIIYNINSKIALNQEINRNLEALARQLYDYWFVQFDFPDENGRPYKSSGGKMVWNEKLKREIPEGWNVEEIGTILGKIKGSIRLQTDEYMSNGKYPIIDQTTGVYYAGFTDNEDAVVQESTVVVFGDHSCAVKYVNFPFVRGADGTQILKSNIAVR